MKKTSNFDADIVISGLGPTGLVLAHCLGKRGHRVIVLEREPLFYGNARAVYTDDECMRVFQSVGVAEELQKNMLLDTPAQWVLSDGSVLSQYGPLKQPFGWPHISFFYQPYLETSLSDLLAKYPNVEICRGREVIDFSQDGQSVSIEHRATQESRSSDHSGDSINTGLAEDIQHIRARYLVGADGGRSIVREKLGIKMTGKNFPEPWLVVDLKMKDGEDAIRHIPYFNFYCDPDCPAVSCPQPDGYHRFEFMLKPGQTKEYMEKPETVRKYLSKYVDPDKFEVKRRLVYTFNALMAERWRDQRVLLAGDAAHMTPQFMGQGASSGVRDAYNIAWKLSAILEGKADDSLLDSYQTERQHHAQAMIDISVLMKDIVSISSPVKALARNVGIKLGLATPFVRDFFYEGKFKPSPVYKKGEYFGLPRRKRNGPEGAMSPQPEVRNILGRRQLLDDITGDNFALVGYETDPRATLSQSTVDFLDSIGCRYINVMHYGNRPQNKPNVERSTPEGLVEVEDLQEQMTTWFEKAGKKEGSVAILRPDKFSFAVVSAKQAETAVQQLKTMMLPSQLKSYKGEEEVLDVVTH
ncbi:3-(3-hydroxy-phenyl)propionate/3-hydroxycinnamic acid hydroxylase [Zhongshania aliphaticivorans]|uniref:3-(3-hydroxy-phenyl)propionate/3-hydroxycinnamic acid hydroxylase n=1 Tax=Zhongshania aliphaticivorans TaxID=1470434 RepID=A0A5S9NP85_9GAMM|nr:bifunctional 3-(3-hydroxy-phenyl)propionate/3-hydroxycinnamic acid hydroxylase [Zhongshania aliphaticivorans]CAA0092174.1 3-(3-hydroxy-phenyl)propionate/3-hydroxycinnamic acid hydroxylase [Zhongshania aliphaticivorans]CAA0109318.1 3-(3-hydroxy-phenyl)propionate/3-hydroxycinnamic acid hydroxylase [Zhongshania aliphaticivorans]